MFFCFYYLDVFQEKPYVMLREGNLTGNARFEGFCIDLLKWIAGQVGFQYTIRLVPDNVYGVYDPETKQWNGIVHQLMEKVSIKIVFFIFLQRCACSFTINRAFSIRFFSLFWKGVEIYSMLS